MGLFILSFAKVFFKFLKPTGSNHIYENLKQKKPQTFV